LNRKAISFDHTLVRTNRILVQPNSTGLAGLEQMETTLRQARDEWLALRCKLRRPGAFEDLIKEMERPLLYYVSKLLTDESQGFDVLQEVWLTAFRRIARLEEPRAIRPWLYRIAHALVVDRIRHNASQERAERTWAESPEIAEESYFDAEDAAAIHKALDDIDSKHREVLVLHFLNSMSIAEIASILDCPEGTVKSRIYYAKQALKEMLARGGYGPQEQ
jgi:RNA polymerase sigma-70 factor, ECF subfamily